MEDLIIDGRVILKLASKMYVRMSCRCIGLGAGTMLSSYECPNDPLDSIKTGISSLAER